MVAEEETRFHISRITDLLSPFVDSSSSLKVRPSPTGGFDVSGSRRFQDFQLHLEPTETEFEYNEIRLRRRRRVETSLTEVLRRPSFGNLDALARSMLQHLKGRIEDRPFVEGSVVACSDSQSFPGEISENASSATGTIERTLGFRPAGQAHLAFLHADAGGGKSWALMHAALQQAQRFLSNEDRNLFLYVDAQGANLRNLEQQISLQLDVYNGILRFSEVIPLMQLGAVSLIIDGFDELIMPSGYNDTLNALASYLESLQGRGSVLASARSAFFHTYDLQTAGVKVRFPVVQSVLELQPWSDIERTRLCEELNLDDLADRLETFAARDSASSQLLGRPFVVVEILRLLKEGNDPQEAELMLAIEHAFLDRERNEKLLDQASKSPLLTEEQFLDLMMEIALEMWHLGETNLDVDSLKIITKVTAEQWGLRHEVRELLAHRIDLNPLLESSQPGQRAPNVRFPHELLFSRFLARAILRNLVGSDSEAIRILREAPLSDSVVEQTALVARLGKRAVFGPGIAGPDNVLGVIGALGDRVSLRSDDRNARLNLGSLARSLLPFRSGTAPLTLKRCIFDKARFQGAILRGVEFQDCQFEDVDGRGVCWDGVVFSHCPPIQKLTLDASQKFPPTAPEVIWLIECDPEGKTEDFFGQDQTRPRLFPDHKPEAREGDGVADLSERAVALTDLALKLARRSLRTFWIAIHEEDTDDRGRRAMKQAPHWIDLIALLEKHGIAYRPSKQRRGANPAMIHVEQPQALILGAEGQREDLPREIVAFWREVTNL